MEPFNVTLNQVNVNVQELGQDRDYEKLCSFGNLVSYDSDFQDRTETHSEPVAATKVSLNLSSSAWQDTHTVSELIQAEARDHYLQSLARNADIFKSPTYQSTLKEFRKKKEQYGSHITGQDDSELPPRPRKSSPKQSPLDLVVNADMTSPDPSNARDPDLYTLRGVTDVEEALALQQSVIGDVDKKPASAEQIAAVIEATRQRLTQNKSSTNEDGHSLLEDSHSLPEDGRRDSNDNFADLPPEGVNHYEGTKFYDQRVKTDDLSHSSSDQDTKLLDLDPRDQGSKDKGYTDLAEGDIVDSPSILVGGGTVQTFDSGIAEQGSFVNNDLSPHLIPIPSDQMVVEKQKSSWFSQQRTSTPMKSTQDAKHPKRNEKMPPKVEQDLNGTAPSAKSDVCDGTNDVPAGNVSSNVGRDSQITDVMPVLAHSELEIENDPPSLPCMSQLPHEASQGGDTGSEKARILALLKMKARLEGQVEMLESESKVALQERAQLHSQVAALTQTLKSQEEQGRKTVRERDALSADYETLRLNRSRLEEEIIKGQKAVLEKVEEVKRMEEEVRGAQEEVVRVEDQKRNLREELLSKENTVDDMKSKIAELYVDFQTANQDKILAESEIVSLKSELRTVKTGKEWYMEQLESSQETRNQLQMDITQLRRDLISQRTVIERLKADNMRIEQKMKATEQSALVEKEQLAGHLEAIEMEILEREAAFAQIQRDRQNVENMLQSQMGQSGEIPKEVQEDLDQLRRDVTRAETNAKVLELEKAELAKRLALSEESVVQRVNEIKALEERVGLQQADIEQALEEKSNSEREVTTLSQQLAASQVQLVATQSEKEAFDRSLTLLKTDLGRVETSFRQMKAEVGSRDCQLMTLTAERDRLREEVARSVQVHAREPIRVEELAKSEERIRELEEALRLAEDDARKVSEAEETKMMDRKRIEQVMSTTQSQLGEAQKSLQVVVEEKAVLEEKLRLASEEQEKHQVELEAWRERLTGEADGHRKDEEMYQSKVNSLTNELQQATDTINTLQLQHQQQLQESQHQLQVTRQQLEDSQSLNLTDNERLQFQVTETKAALDAGKKNWLETKDELEHELEQTRQALFGEREKYNHKLHELTQQSNQEDSNKIKLEKELQDLTMQLQQAELQLQKNERDFAKKFQEIQQVVQEKEAEKNEGQRCLEAAKEELEVAQRELVEVKREVDVNKQRQNEELQARINDSETRVELLMREKAAYENRLREMHEQIGKHGQIYAEREQYLLQELERLRRDGASVERMEEEKEEAELVMERERGRMTGLLASHRALKEHSSRVEAALAERESSLIELTSHANEELARRERQLREVEERLREADEAMADTKRDVAKLQQQLSDEKTGHSECRRELGVQTTKLSQVELELTQRTEKVEALSVELETSRVRERQREEQAASIKADLVALRQERNELTAQIDAKTAQESLLQQQLKAADWHLSERGNELRALREQLSIVESRQQRETQEQHGALYSANMELGKLREDLNTVKQEKKELQARAEKLKELLHENSPDLDLTSPNGDLSARNPDLKLPSTHAESRPLSVIQTMLGRLRGEITGLQNQVERHTSAAHDQSQAWKELEAQVEDLRMVCRTSAADREASQTLLETSKLLTQQATQPIPS